MKDLVTLNIVIAIVVVFLSGAYIIFNKPSQKPIASTVYVSERLQACEAKGGKYSLIWSNYNNEYHEGCSIVSQDIEEF